MIVCFRPFFPPIIEKKQQHLEFTLNVKLVRAFIAHVYRYHPPLPHPFWTPFPVIWRSFSFYYIREVILFFVIWLSFRSNRLTKSWRNRDLTVLRFFCSTFIAPAQSELADNGGFTFILFLVSSGHVSIKRKLSLRLKTLHLMFVVWSTFHVSGAQWRSSARTRVAIRGLLENAVPLPLSWFFIWIRGRSGAGGS